jgi:hypothetical protein
VINDPVRTYPDLDPDSQAKLKAVLADTLEALPLLMVPEPFCTADGTLSVGPGTVLPTKTVVDGVVVHGWRRVTKTNGTG